VDPEGSSQPLHEEALVPYQGKACSSRHTLILFISHKFQYHLIYAYSFHDNLFLSGYPSIHLHTSVLYFVGVTCPTHIIASDFMQKIMLDEDYK
jgi:hypothetical protein